MSSYTGLYVQRLSDGTIHSVQVRDTAGNELPLDPSEYVARRIQPSIEALPDAEEYKVRGRNGA